IIQLATISMLSHCLTKNIDLASTGSATINLVKQNKYDLILLDIGLPDLNGYEVCREIRKLDNGLNTPVIAVTAQDESIQNQKLTESGINDLIVKPLNPNKISTLYKKWL
ncbi:MAG TPA: response regulator, partial [Gammaproteobacteria bacterium]|nr:response regulator [Gammaproteobacteria bacterium]